MVYRLKDTWTKYMNIQGESVMTLHKFWNLCPIQLCLSNELCSNQRIHAPNANNFGLGRQRVLRTDWFSTLHYSIPLIKRVRKLQSVIIWKAFEEQKFGHLLIGDKLNLAVEVLDAIPEKSASAWQCLGFSGGLQHWQDPVNNIINMVVWGLFVTGGARGIFANQRFLSGADQKLLASKEEGGDVWFLSSFTV